MRGRAVLGPASLLVLLAVLALALLPVLAPAARGANSNALPLTGGVNGPANVGTGLKGSYVITAHGGPAEALNGTQVGTYSYKASISAVNTANASVRPVSGVLVNFTAPITLTAPNVTEPLTIYVLVTSTLGAANVSQNFSYSIHIVQPYQLSAQLIVGPNAGVSAFSITVLLDNQPVGSIAVGGLPAGTSHPITFSYVPGVLSPGWHTFLLSLALEHGLVAFSGGEQVLTVSFFVTGGGPDYTPWYLAGAAVFGGAIFISSTRVGGPRRGRPKK